MKNVIFDEFTNRFDNENDIESIINLIDCLEVKNKEKKEKEKMINEFLQKLISKNLFSKE